MPDNFKPDLAQGTGAGGPHGWGVWRRWTSALLLAGILLPGMKAAEPVPPAFRQLPPLPSMREAAAAAHMDLVGMASLEAGNEINNGDTVTILASLTKGREMKQWLIELEARPTTLAERAKPRSVFHNFTSSGHELTIEADHQAIRIRMIGPLERSDAGTGAAAKPEVKVQRVLVSGAFLSLGLDRVPALMLRLVALSKTDPHLPEMNLNFSDKPFPADVVARASKGAAARSVTADDERAFIGSIMALSEFAQLTSKTPGVKDIFISVVDIPWWSILLNRGKVDLNLNFGSAMSEIESRPWQLPAVEKMYAMPCLMTINGKPGLLFQLALAAPKPPLALSAGIVGLAAMAPDGKGPVLTFQVVASHATREPALP